MARSGLGMGASQAHSAFTPSTGSGTAIPVRAPCEAVRASCKRLWAVQVGSGVSIEHFLRFACVTGTRMCRGHQNGGIPNCGVFH